MIKNEGGFGANMGCIFKSFKQLKLDFLDIYWMSEFLTLPIINIWITID